MAIFKSAWLCIRPDGSLLMARSKDQDLFYTVGGKCEPGESSVEALKREVMEETGVKLIPETISMWRRFEGTGVGTHMGERIVIDTFFALYLGSLLPTGEIAALDWFHLRDGERTTDLGRRILRMLEASGIIT